MAVTTLPGLEDRIESLLKAITDDIRPCRACGRMLYFVRLLSGSCAPYTREGVNHFVDCPEASRFRSGARRV